MPRRRNHTLAVFRRRFNTIARACHATSFPVELGDDFDRAVALAALRGPVTFENVIRTIDCYVHAGTVLDRAALASKVALMINGRELVGADLDIFNRYFAMGWI